MEPKLITSCIRRVKRIVTAQAAQCCSCQFPIEDKFGKYEGYRPHNNWELHRQVHSDPNFALYLECTGCGYGLARKYWKDVDGTFVDYEIPAEGVAFDEMENGTPDEPQPASTDMPLTLDSVNKNKTLTNVRGGEMNYTQGKWEVVDTLGVDIKSGVVYIAGIHNRDKRIKGKRVSEDGAYDTSETMANARLIASAPEMFEEIKDIQKWILDFRNNVSVENAIKISNRSIRITELMAKVEGKNTPDK